MKLGNWIAALGCLGLGVGAVLAGQGCTVTASTCSGPNCPSFDASYFPPNEDSGNAPDTSVQTDSGSTPIDPCNACLYGQCVGAYSNCVANSSCLGIYQCATSPACAADGGNCVQDCYNGGSTLGKALYIALGTCDQAAECTNITPTAACAATCNASAATCTVTVEDAGPGVDSAAPEDAGTDSGTDAGPVSCSACQASACSAQLGACAAGQPCAIYQQCLMGCASTACNQACAANNPSGVTAAEALGTCTTTNCPQCNQ